MTRAKSKANHNKVYVYGARVRDEKSITLINQQLWLAQNYYNYLCAAEIERRTIFREIRKELGGTAYRDLIEEQEFYSDLIKNLKQVKLGKYNFPKNREKFLSRVENLENNPAYLELDELKKKAKALHETEKKEKARIDKEHFKKWDDEVDLDGRTEKEYLKEIKQGNAIEKADKGGRRESNLKVKIKRRIINDVLELQSIPEYWKRYKKAEVDCLQKDFLWRDMNKQGKTPISRVTENGKRETVWIDAPPSLGSISGDEVRTKAIKRAKKDATFNPNFRKAGGTRVLAVKPEKKKGNSFIDILEGKQVVVKMKLLDVHPDKKQGKHPIYNIDLKLGSRPGIVRLSFKMHRPIPEDAKINNVYIVKSRIGSRDHYEVQFLLQSDLPLIQQAPTGEDTIAIRLGWHKESNNNVLFATAFDGKNIHEYFLPSYMWEQNEHIRSLQEAADDYFNAVHTIIKTWNVQNNEVCEKAYKNWHAARDKEPKNFSKAYDKWNKHSHGWYAMTQGMLAMFCPNDEHKAAWKKWKTKRLGSKPKDLFCEGNEVHFEVICNFLKSSGYTKEEQVVSIFLYFYQLKNSHIIQMTRDLQNKLTNGKLDYYRKWAVALARAYGYVKYEEYDLREIARKKSPEQDTSAIPRKRGQVTPDTVRQFAGVYRAKESIKAVFRDRCVNIATSAIDKTHIDCGESLPDDYKSETGSDKIKCPKCGKNWYIRENMAMQIYNASWVAKEKKGKRVRRRKKNK